MAQLVLNAFALGLDESTQTQLTEALRWRGPGCLDWRWVGFDRFDVLFCHVEAHAQVRLPNVGRQVLVLVVPPASGGQVLDAIQALPSAVVLSLGSDPSAALAEVSRRMASLLQQQAVGWSLASSRSQLEAGAGAYHLMSVEERPRLLGVVDMGRFMALIAPEAEPAQMLSAQWISKPAADSRLSLGFAGATLASCMWQFATRSPNNFLPSRYQSRLIFAKRAMAVEPSLFWPEHVEVLDLLKDEPRTLGQLGLDTGWTPQRLTKILEGLYLAGAVTTQVKVALGRQSGPSTAGVRSSGPHDGQTTAFPEDD